MIILTIIFKHKFGNSLVIIYIFHEQNTKLYMKLGLKSRNLKFLCMCSLSNVKINIRIENVSSLNVCCKNKLRRSYSYWNVINSKIFNTYINFNGSHCWICRQTLSSDIKQDLTRWNNTVIIRFKFWKF